MAQKKAFVRYANNKAVPGSLIVRTKAPKVGTWKEVAYDLCCGSGGAPLSDTIVCTTVETNRLGADRYRVNLDSDETLFSFTSIGGPSTSPITTYQQLIDFLNTTYSFLGEFTYNAPDQICLQIFINSSTSYALQQYPNPINWNISIVPFVP